MNHTERGGGFTLIELLIVIAILGILVRLGLASFLSSQIKSRDSRRKSDLRQVATSLETYYNDKGAYPAGDANGGILGCTPDDVTLCPWGGEFVDKNGTIYMVKLPSDPAAGDHYYYRKSGSGYQLYAALENTNDADYHAGGYAGTNCAGSGTLLCTYGIASTNLTP